jgi:protein TonB
MDPIFATCEISAATNRRGRRRRAAAAAASLMAHLGLVGVLWSAQSAYRDAWRLAGDRGSVALQAAVEQPKPTEQIVVERLLPTQIRIEPDHAHIDRELVPTSPPVERPTLPEPKVAEAPRPVPHVHPHEPHEHPLHELLTAPSASSAASQASPAGTDETLPAAFDNPPPAYPSEALRRRIEGTTVLRIGIRRDGTIEFVAVATSSGHALLDDTAIEAVRRWRFTPGRRSGVAAPFVVRLPIDFRL